MYLKLKSRYCAGFSLKLVHTLYIRDLLYITKNQCYSYCKTRYTPFTVILTFKTLHCNGCY